jgi:hypothetical protein
LQPNSALEADDEDDLQAAGEGAFGENENSEMAGQAEEGQDKEDMSDDDSDKSGSENPEAKSVQTDFSAVKLATKHAAFLRKCKDEKWVVHYSTQN